MKSGRNRWFVDSLLEGTGFEPSVPLLRKALLGVANRRRRHEKRSQLQVQARDGNACLEWFAIAFPFAEGPRVRIRLPLAARLVQTGLPPICRARTPGSTRVPGPRPLALEVGGAGGAGPDRRSGASPPPTAWKVSSIRPIGASPSHIRARGLVRRPTAPSAYDRVDAGK